MKQTRIIFEVGDIKGIRIRCKRCQGELVQTLESNKPTPTSCAHCGEPWQTPGEQQFTARSLTQVLRSVCREDEGATLSVLFEIDDEEKLDILMGVNEPGITLRKVIGIGLSLALLALGIWMMYEWRWFWGYG